MKATAYTSTVHISGSSVSQLSKDRTLNIPIYRSNSAQDLYRRSMMRRSSSDNNICYAVNRASAISTSTKLRNSKSVGILQIPGVVKSFLFEHEKIKSNARDKDYKDEEDFTDKDDEVDKRANWIERLLEIRSQWKNTQPKQNILENTDSDGDGDSGECEVDYNDDEGGVLAEEDNYKETLADLLVEVGLSDTRLFSQLAFLSNMAYVIPSIKAKDLRRYYRLRFITSSLEKKADASAVEAKLEEDSTRLPITSKVSNELCMEKSDFSNEKYLNRPYVAHDIAASAASYTHSRDKGHLLIGSDPQLKEKEDGQNRNINGLCDEGGTSPSRVKKSEVAAFIAASTMTAVIAAGENEKLQAAKELQSLESSPCEWFVCDDYSTYTRCFVIQGSDSLSAWHANLFFEPMKFETSDVLVHKGIYEAAKGIYEQFIPEIMDHIQRFGDRAKLQFTGHSLGGSLSLLVNMMLLSRKAVKPYMLRPVVTFGSSYVFCGGQKLLDELGVDENQIHCVMMHRDIVPRAFSCNYPNHVAQLLKRLYGTFRTHPCLNKNKLLYTPLGKTFILQPDEKWSPTHPLLPRGSAFYYLDKTKSKSAAAALRTFLNSPHPLETLSDPTAYGSGGTLLRDHDSSNYLKAMNWVLRQKKKPRVDAHKVEECTSQTVMSSPSLEEWSRLRNNLRNKRLLSAKVAINV